MFESHHYPAIGLVVLVVIAVTAAIVRYSMRYAARVRGDLELFLRRSKLSLPGAGASESATYAGIDYTASFEPGTRSRPGYYQITIAAKNHGVVKLRRERSIDRVFKRIGFVVEVQTKDLAFDREIFIDSAEPVFARALFSKAPARDAVMTIFACGFSRISIEADTISTRLYHKDTRASHNRDIHDAIAALNSLVVDQPKIPAHLAADALKAWRWRLGIVYTFIGVLALTGTGGAWLCQQRFRPLDNVSMFAHSQLFALPLLGVLFVLLGLLLRGRSNSHVHFGTSSAIALAAAVSLSYAAFGLNNAYRDDSEARRYELTVTDKKVTGGKSSSYRLIVPSWRNSGETENLTVSRALYRQAVAGRTRVEVITRAGHFGYEWFAQSAAIIQPSRPQESSTSALQTYE